MKILFHRDEKSFSLHRFGLFGGVGSCLFSTLGVSRADGDFEALSACADDKSRPSEERTSALGGKGRLRRKFFPFFFFFYTFLPNFVISLSETGTNAYGRTLRNTYARVRNPVYYGYMCRERT